MRRRAAGLLAALAGLLAIGAPPAAADVVTVRGASGPGPERYDRVTVERFGPRSARRVLVLVPGLGGGAGDFALLGPELVRRVPGLQVWALDRRSQALEDTRGFDTGDPDRARDYYLGGGGSTAAASRRSAATPRPSPASGACRSRSPTCAGWCAPRAAAGGACCSAATRSAPPPPRPTRPGTSAGAPATATSAASC